MTGSASLRAAAAASLLPEAIASSTLRTEPLRRVRRALLTAARRVAWRVAFFADFVLAMRFCPRNARAGIRQRGERFRLIGVLYNERSGQRQPRRETARGGAVGN